MTFRVSARDGKMTRSFPPFVFKVRKLPDPTAYIALGSDRYKGGNLSKAGLMGADHLSAAIDDGILDIQFRVTGFSAVFYDNMGNAVQMASQGASFTDRMREQFRHLTRPKVLYHGDSCRRPLTVSAAHCRCHGGEGEISRLINNKASEFL